MDSLLNNNVFIIEEMQEDEYDDIETTSDPLVSVWIKDKDLVRASTDLTILQKIEPGVYTAEYHRDLGYFCKQLKSNSDELYTFSDSITQNLLDEINLFWDKKDLYKANNLLHKRGILLEGYPGTGKSSIISLLSSEIIKKEGVVFVIPNPGSLAIYIAFMRSGFRKIQPDTPIVTIIEDIDQYENVLLELLDFLDGKTNLEHHVIIATTNNTEDIPDTILRPSRIDLRVLIPYPSESTRREYFKHKNAPEELLELLVTKSNKCSLADLKELYICVFLLNYSIDDAVRKIICPKDKKNYLQNPANTNKIGL